MGILDQETVPEEAAANRSHPTSGFLWDCLAQVNASSCIFGSMLGQQDLFPIRVICYCCWKTNALQKTAIRKGAGCNLCAGSVVLSALGFSPCHKLWSLCFFDSASFVPDSANLLYCLRSCIYQKVEESLAAWFILPKEQKCIYGGQLFHSHYTAVTHAKQEINCILGMQFLIQGWPFLFFCTRIIFLSQCQTGLYIRILRGWGSTHSHILRMKLRMGREGILGSNWRNTFFFPS